jgi:CRISPR-associated protein Cas2
MYLVVSYDIRDDRRRTRVHQTLKNFGERVQYSVFECDLTKEQILRLQHIVKKIIDADADDSVRYFFLCDSCKGKIERIGGIIPREEGPVLV